MEMENKDINQENDEFYIKKQFTITASYDKTCNMGYISISKKDDDDILKQIVIEDKENNLQFIIDINQNEQLIGIEVFNASKRFPNNLKKELIK